MTIERMTSRPWRVRKVIAHLMNLAAEIESHRVELSRISLDMKELGADTSELVDASHEIDHAWRHVTAARRSLVMTWPDEVDEP